MTLALVPCELGGIVVESAIYGVFLVLFITCLYCLLYRRRAGGRFPDVPVNKTMVMTSFILFISITSHWILDIARLFRAFATENRDPLAYYANLSTPINVAKTGLYVFECIAADIILCYRLWLIWGGKITICIFPLCTTLAFLVTGTGITYQFSKLKPGEAVFLSVCSRWITSAFACTLATNLYCTSIISYKIWSVNRAIKGSIGHSSATMRVIVIIVESAAVYTCCSLVTLISYLLNSDVQFPALDSTSPVVGCVFCLIIVRVCLGLDHHTVSTTQQRPMRSWAPIRRTHKPVDLNRQGEEYGMNPVNICISRHVTSDSDGTSLRKTHQSV